MASTVVHGAGWLAIPLIALAGIGYLALVSWSLSGGRSVRTRRMKLVPHSMRFTDLYAMFGIVPLARERWPVLQSEANRIEDANLARFVKRPLRARRSPR